MNPHHKKNQCASITKKDENRNNLRESSLELSNTVRRTPQFFRLSKIKEPQKKTVHVTREEEVLKKKKSFL